MLFLAEAIDVGAAATPKQRPRHPDPTVRGAYQVTPSRTVSWIIFVAPDQTVHPAAIVEAVQTPEEREPVSPIVTDQADALSQTIDAVIGHAVLSVDPLWAGSTACAVSGIFPGPRPGLG